MMNFWHIFQQFSNSNNNNQSNSNNNNQININAFLNNLRNGGEFTEQNLQTIREGLEENRNR